MRFNLYSFQSFISYSNFIFQLFYFAFIFIDYLVYMLLAAFIHQPYLFRSFALTLQALSFKFLFQTWKCIFMIIFKILDGRKMLNFDLLLSFIHLRCLEFQNFFFSFSITLIEYLYLLLILRYYSIILLNPLFIFFLSLWLLLVVPFNLLLRLLLVMKFEWDFLSSQILTHLFNLKLEVSLEDLILTLLLLAVVATHSISIENDNLANNNKYIIHIN